METGDIYKWINGQSWDFLCNYGEYFNLLWFELDLKEEAKGKCIFADSWCKSGRNVCKDCSLFRRTVMFGKHDIDLQWYLKMELNSPLHITRMMIYFILQFLCCFWHINAENIDIHTAANMQVIISFFTTSKSKGFQSRENELGCFLRSISRKEMGK